MLGLLGGGEGLTFLSSFHRNEDEDDRDGDGVVDILDVITMVQEEIDYQVELGCQYDGDLVYGVNTGFGKLSSVSIQKSDIKQLQLNLVRSHASGLGKPFDNGIVRVIMVLKILTWAKGFSGVRPKLVQHMIGMFNNGILPVIPSLGSVGASGDLAPLSHYLSQHLN